MRNKLAIVGCASRTRDLVDYSDPDLDIWVLNESAQKEWCKRADAVFQLHDPSIWKNPLNRGDKGHGEWLMSGNTPLIYMLEAYPEVPKAVKLPTEDIVKSLLSGLTVDSERGRKDYFTSTIAFSIAMGIYLGYPEIHTYGVELADPDEYHEQLPCAMFWMGIAIGKGIKFVSHSNMFDAPLYPTESFVGLDKSVFTDQMEKLAPQRDAMKVEVQRAQNECEFAIKQFEDSGSKIDELRAAIKQTSLIAQRFGILDGAIQENKRYLERSKAMEGMTGTYVFSKHEFVRDQNAIGARREHDRAELNGAAQQVENVINSIEPKLFNSARRKAFKDLRAAIDNFIKRVVVIAMYTGAITEDSRFIELIQAEKKKVFENSTEVKIDQAN